MTDGSDDSAISIAATTAYIIRFDIAPRLHFNT